MGAAGPSFLPLSLSPAHLESPASLRPRCHSLFTNWLANLCSACGHTRHHTGYPSSPPSCSEAKTGLSTTPAAHLMGVPRAGE